MSLDIYAVHTFWRFKYKYTHTWEGNAIEINEQEIYKVSSLTHYQFSRYSLQERKTDSYED